MSTDELTIDQANAEPEAAPPLDFSGPVTIIEPARGWLSLNFGELWRYRDLLFLLVKRDFAAQYRQSVLGVGWAFFNPVFTMILNTIVFSRMAKFTSDDIPYPVFNLYRFAGLGVFRRVSERFQ